MAINSQKLLPPSKIKTSSSIIKAEKIVPSLYKKTPELSSKEDSAIILSNEITTIRKTVIDIDQIFENMLLRQRRGSEDRREEIENEERIEKEEQIEKKKNKFLSAFKGINIPKLGFLDAINRFITFTLLGWAFKRIYPYIPQILEFIKNIQPVIKFIEILAGNFFSSVVNFIDAGYKAYDQIRAFSKTLGGDQFQKTFDEFTGNLNKFINLAIIAGMLATGGSGLGGKPKRGISREGEYRNGIRSGQYNGFNTRTSRNGTLLSRTGDSLLRQRMEKGLDFKTALVSSEKDIMKRYFQRYGREKFIQRFGEEGLKKLPSGMRRGFLQRGIRGAFMRTFGKRGARIARGSSKVFGKLPIIGGLIDFVIKTLIFKESPDRAAAGAIGATLGTAIGTAIATSGTVASMGLGSIVAPLVIYASGMAGDWIGTSLFDAIKFYQSQNKPIKKQAVGGKVTTRKGKVVGGAVKRTVRKPIISPKAKPVIPGSSVGGKKKVQNIFPEVPKEQKGKMVDPFGLITKVTKSMSEVPFLGQFASLMGGLLLGEFPGPKQIKTIASGINAWINNAIAKGSLKGNLVQGFADGGMIDIESEMKKDITGWVEGSLEQLIKNKVTEAINEVKKNLSLKPLQEMIPRTELTEEMSELGSASDAVGGAKLLMNAGFPMLAAAILSGNIQQESGWQGQRTPWVLNDGAGTNKGLISWNRSRIANAEKFLGKPLETASNAEQIKWIKEELKQYGLLDIFLNPNSTEEQLKEASYKYIGWGDLGERWTYSKRIFASLQAGEVGTYRPPTTRSQGTGRYAPQKPGFFNAIEYITGDKSHPNFELKKHGLPGNYHDHIAFATISDKERAKTALRNAGIQLGSEYRAGDPGYHGMNLAIDVPGSQWDGSGAIGNREFEGSKRVRSILGLMKGGNVNQKFQPLKRQRNITPLESQAFYEEFENTSTLILPIIIEKQIPVPVYSRSSVMFNA